LGEALSSREGLRSGLVRTESPQADWTKVSTSPPSSVSKDRSAPMACVSRWSVCACDRRLAGDRSGRSRNAATAVCSVVSRALQWQDATGHSDDSRADVARNVLTSAVR